MQSDELNRFWTKEFGDALPVAYELKWKFQERWFRIHTLPDSKRYPDNGSEYDEILCRHNFILNEFLDTNEKFILISTSYSANVEPIRTPKLEDIGLQTNCWQSIRIDDDDATVENYCHLFIDESIWQVGSLDSLFRLIADDEISEVMLISVKRKFVYHPYDGGADVILENGLIRDRYKQRYEQWLSARPDGL